MSEGIIMSLNKRTAVVLKPDGQFIKIRRQQHYEIGASITDLSTVRAVPRIRQRMLQWGAATAALLIFLYGVWAIQPPPVVAYVSMDINPSIELGLDQKERVRTLRAVNEDAEAFIKGLNYKGKGLEAVMNEIAQKLVNQHILTVDHPEVVIASVPMRALSLQWEKHVTQTMTRILNEATEQVETENKIHLDVTTVSLPAEIRIEAEEKGVSSGKMAFWLVSESQGHDVSIETLKEDSIKNIAASWGGVKEVMSHYDNVNADTVVEEDKSNGIKQDKPQKTSKDNNIDTKLDNEKTGNNKPNSTVPNDKKTDDKKAEKGKSDDKSSDKAGKGSDKDKDKSNNKKSNIDNDRNKNDVKDDKNNKDDKNKSGIEKHNNENNYNNNNNNIDNKRNRNENDNSERQKERWKQLLESSQEKDKRPAKSDGNSREDSSRTIEKKGRGSSDSNRD